MNEPDDQHSALLEARPWILDEEQVLGAVLLEPARLVDVRGWLRPTDFSDPARRRIWKACTEADDLGEPLEPMALAERIAKDAERRHAARTYILDLCRKVTSSAFLLHHARRAAAWGDLRALRRVAHGISDDVEEAPPDTEAIRVISEGASRDLFEIGEREEGRQAKSIGQALAETLAELEAAADHGGLVGIGTGLDDADRWLGGLRRGDLVIAAGRPGTGKTALAQTIAISAARRTHECLGGRPASVALFSLEMSTHQLSARLLAGEAELDLHRLLSGRIGAEDRTRLHEAQEELRRLPVVLDDSGSLSIAEVRGRARRLKQQGDLDLIVVDYLQLMGGGGRFENRQLEVGAISRGLKQMARELDLPVLAVSQLSRKCEERADKRPILSDLRESGSIEQDADVVMFLYRPVLYDEAADPGEAELIIAKQRQGPTNRVKLQFQPRRCRFVNALWAQPGPSEEEPRGRGKDQAAGE